MRGSPRIGTIRRTLFSLLAGVPIILYLTFFWGPTVTLASSRGEVCQILGQPTKRLELSQARESFPSDCDGRRIAYALCFRRSFWRIVIVYFDDRDTVVCTETGFSIVAK
jgi:hypothetical protein